MLAPIRGVRRNKATMYHNGTLNVAVLVGFYDEAGQPGLPRHLARLRACEDIRLAHPLLFPEGMPRPAQFEAVNVTGQIVVLEGKTIVRVAHWERAGRDTIHPRMYWITRGSPMEYRPDDFMPIIKPGSGGEGDANWCVKSEIMDALPETSGFGPAHAAVESDPRTRDLLLRPMSRRRRHNMALVTGLVVGLREFHQPGPEDDMDDVGYWMATLAIGPGVEDRIGFQFRVNTKGFTGAVARFKQGPTPITLCGYVRSFYAAEHPEHHPVARAETHLDCENALLVAPPDFDGQPPQWIKMALRASLGAVA